MSRNPAACPASRRYQRTLVGLALGSLLLSAPVTARGMDRLPLHGRCTVRFATREQGRALLTRRDAYLEAVGRFDREVRTRQPGASDAQYVTFIQQHVLEWDGIARQRVSTALQAVQARLAPWKLPLPETLWLVHTTGVEESNAAYCRQNTIVLPRKMTRLPVAGLERLLIHELFHVLSNQNPDLRRAAYAAIGFEVIEPVTLPGPLHDRKITNPDAPQVDCFVRVPHEGTMVSAGPILVSKAPFQPADRRTMFDLLEFRLVVLDLDPSGTRAQVRLVEGRPILLEPERPTFFWHVGLNTDYLIHPDEIMAENFVHLIRGETNLPTPRIVASLRALLE